MVLVKRGCSPRHLFSLHAPRWGPCWKSGSAAGRGARQGRWSTRRSFQPLWCIGDLRGWLTTVVGRISLDMLRARKARRENYPGNWLLEPLVEEPAEDG
jgi:hypothetical protein